MTRTLLLLGLLLGAAPVPAADPSRPLKATFQTTDCSGATGLGSVNIDRIDRLQPHRCDNGRALHQVLVRNAAGSFDVYTVTPSEAGKLEAQIQQAMDARRRALEKGTTIHIDR